MTRTRLGLCALFALSIAVAAPVPKDAKKENPFPYTVGTKWEYIHDGDEKKVWVEEVTECEEKDGAITFKVDITPDEGEKRFEVYRLKDGEHLPHVIYLHGRINSGGGEPVAFAID